jgi:ubiquinone/menaquinone biosynthesis C-methylase UbiE
MKTNWAHHFKYYDLFQNNFDKYRATIKFQLAKLTNCQKVLDSGAGSGNLTLGLLKKGKQVTAVDFNKFALKILKKKCKKYSKNLKVRQTDVTKLNFRPNEFDGVSSMFVISFVNDNKKYFSEVYRVLKKGGKFVISSWASVPDAWKGIIEIQKKELKRKGILPRYNLEWEHMMNSSKIAIDDVVNGPNFQKIKTMLKETGFKNIKNYPKNPYKKYAYFLTCKK